MGVCTSIWGIARRAFGCVLSLCLVSSLSLSPSLAVGIAQDMYFVMKISGPDSVSLMVHSSK